MEKTVTKTKDEFIDKALEIIRNDETAKGIVGIALSISVFKIAKGIWGENDKEENEDGSTEQSNG